MSGSSASCSACGSPIPEGIGLCLACASAATATSTAGSRLTTPATRRSREASFTGTDRFVVERKLGAGGMGVVYAAHDRQRGETVALKTLFNRDALMVSRLKREFRALADVTHPNLVALYELVAEDDVWFYTMELIDGADFFRAVRAGLLDVERLRHLLGQVVEGLVAVHAAGKLHRDLKPSNIMVTRADRAVILDFGIVGELEPSAAQTAVDGVVGTVAYMAPEQLEGRADARSDCYALGVVLYQALTGRLPFVGSPYEIAMEKRTRDPEPPELLADVPPDLAQLSLALMTRDPAGRPGLADVLSRLGLPSRPLRPPPGAALRPSAIVGRERQIAALDEALAAVETRLPVTVCIHGSSGTGKSALTQWFIRHRLPENAIVFQGRCYPRESIPYKALDGVIEGVSWFLRSLSNRQRKHLLPKDVSALARVFPVLEWLDETVSAAGALPAGEDAIQVRRRAFAALAELLGKLAPARTVVIYIDDLQWGDKESLVALDELLRPPTRPPLLMVIAFPTEEAASRPFLRDLLERARRADQAPEIREIFVEPLSEHHTRELAGRLLGESAPAEHVDAIVSESRGVPFLVELLARYVSATSMAPAEGGVTIEQMIDAQLRELPDGSRELLETVAIAGRPVASIVARDASHVAGSERRLVGALQSASLLRPGHAPAEIEVYHDRIRRSVDRQIAPSRRVDLHLGLARAMESHGVDEPETLSQHYAGANERGLAAIHAGRAAGVAAHKFAFERAAALYRQAIDFNPDAENLSALQVGLAESLGNAGRGVDAARAYVIASTRDGVDGVEMRRRAADHLLRCGRVDEALEIVQAVAIKAGLGFARSRSQIVARLLARRCWHRLRGLRFAERTAADIDAGLLAKIDLCSTLASGLSRVDGVRAADFSAKALSLALKAGEPVRVANAFVIEAAFSCLAGGRAGNRPQQLLQAATVLADRLQHPQLTALIHLVRGMAHGHLGSYAASLRETKYAQQILRERCVGVWREIDLAQAYEGLALYHMGEIKQLAQQVPRRLQEARDHDDRYAVADTLGLPNVLWLARDDVDGAREALRDIYVAESDGKVDWPDWLRVYAECQIDLYAGDAIGACRRTESEWPRFARATTMWVQSSRIETHDLAARCALAAAAASPDSSSGLALAKRHADALSKERMPWGDALADQVRAAIADRTGDGDAYQLAARAIHGFEATNMTLCAQATRRRYGAMLGGDEGRQMIAAADAWMRAQGVVNPERMTAVFAPGFREAGR